MLHITKLRVGAKKVATEAVANPSSCAYSFNCRRTPRTKRFCQIELMFRITALRISHERRRKTSADPQMSASIIRVIRPEAQEET